MLPLLKMAASRLLSIVSELMLITNSKAPPGAFFIAAEHGSQNNACAMISPTCTSYLRACTELLHFLNAADITLINLNIFNSDL